MTTKHSGNVIRMPGTNLSDVEANRDQLHRKHRRRQTVVAVFGGAAVLSSLLVANNLFGINKGEAAPSSGESVSGEVTFFKGATFRTSPDLTTTPDGSISDQNVAFRLLSKQTLTIKNPIIETSANGDVWYGGALGGVTRNTVYADVSRIKADEIGGQKYVQDDTTGNYSGFKLDNGQYTDHSSGINNPVGFAEIHTSK